MPMPLEFYLTIRRKADLSEPHSALESQKKKLTFSREKRSAPTALAPQWLVLPWHVKQACSPQLLFKCWVHDGLRLIRGLEEEHESVISLAFFALKHLPGWFSRNGRVDHHNDVARGQVPREPTANQDLERIARGDTGDICYTKDRQRGWSCSDVGKDEDGDLGIVCVVGSDILDSNPELVLTEVAMPRFYLKN